MKTRILFTIFMVFWVTVVVAQNNVGIGTASPVAKLEVRGNGIGYNVFNASNDKIGPFDSILSFSSLGNLGIGTTNTGTYKLVSIGSPSAFSPQIEVWQGNPNLPSSRVLGDITDVGLPAFNGSFRLYLNGNKKIELKALGDSYLNGGNVGIGIGMGPLPPNEMLHLGGAIVVGGTTASSPLAGTIQWNGTHFQGYVGNGAWLNLDVQAQTQYWMQQLSPFGQPELLPNTWPGSLSMGPAGAPNPGGMVWLPDLAGPGLFPHQLMLESTNIGPFNASVLFRRSDWSQPQPLTISEYSVGIFNGDNSFKIYKGPALGATTQGDNFSMFRANPSGIIDLANQSRVRAFQTDQNNLGQLITQNTWTPVNFNNDSPLVSGYDQQNEFITAASAHVTPAPPENAFFTAKSDGYYQVNARCEFDVTTYTEPQGGSGNVIVANGDWVTIAIYVGPQPGQTNPYAWGNILQIGYNSPNPQENKLWNNNAPNVSDVVYLQAGQIISIWVYQTASTPMNLIPGSNRLYVSIHKVS